MAERATGPAGAPPPGSIGRRRFLGGVGFVVGAGAVAGVLPSGPARAVAAGATRFVPLPQTRIADTRRPELYPVGYLPTGIRVYVTGRAGVPDTATAVVVTVTAVNQTGFNYVTAYPAGGAIPVVSNLNMGARYEVAANLATVPLGRVDGNQGAVDLTSFGPADLIVDVAGYYEPVNGAVSSGRFVPLGQAVRVTDTRQTGLAFPRTSVDVLLDGFVPADASSVVVNLTTTDTLGWGYFTCYGLDEASPPDSSNLNVNGPGETRAGAAFVKITTRGDGRRGFRVFTFGGGHVIVDVMGYITGPSSPFSTDGLFVPLPPERFLDTRSGPGRKGRVWPGWVIDAMPPPAAMNAAAVVANVTCVDALNPGYFTVLKAGSPLLNVSHLNANVKGQSIANHVISRISTAGVMVYSYAGAHVLMDIAGYYTGVPERSEVRYTNPPPPPVAPPWFLEIPNIGFASWVYDGNSYAVVDRGNTWHWTGTGDVGQSGAHIGLFHHRTESRNPIRNLHLVGPGDVAYMTTTDGRRFTYRYARRDITNSNPTNILNATRFHPGSTISLIACSKPDTLPTSLSWRLIVTLAQESWVEI
jgi:Sortase domain